MKTFLISIFCLMSALACSASPLGVGDPATAGLFQTSSGESYIGYTSIGTNISSTSYQKTFELMKFTAPTSGVVTVYIYSSCASAGTDLKVGLYTESGALVSGSPVEFANVGVWSVQWKSFAIGISVTNATTYWVALETSQNGDPKIYYDSTGINSRRSKTSTYSDPWTDPFGTATEDNFSFSVKVTITP